MANITQTDILQDMSYLLGEQTIPTTGIEERKAFVQRALERTLRAHNFEDVKAIATVSLSGGQATLPSDIGYQPDLDVRVVNSGSTDDYIFERVSYEDKDNAVQGDYKYWITGSEGSYTLNTYEAGDYTLSVRYSQKAPSINASISTTFPSSMVLALGAMVYYRQSENPLADIAQDEARYQQELQEVISREIRNRPNRRGRSIQEVFNVYTGDVD